MKLKLVPETAKERGAMHQTPCAPQQPSNKNSLNRKGLKQVGKAH